MDAGLWHFLGSQRVGLKARPFFLLALRARRPRAIGFYQKWVFHPFFGENVVFLAYLLCFLSDFSEIFSTRKTASLPNYFFDIYFFKSWVFHPFFGENMVFGA